MRLKMTFELFHAEILKKNVIAWNNPEQKNLKVHKFDYIIDRVRGLHLEGDSLAREGLDKNLHTVSLKTANWRTTQLQRYQS